MFYRIRPVLLFPLICAACEATGPIVVPEPGPAAAIQLVSSESTILLNAGESLRQPIFFKVTDADGLAVPNARVEFLLRRIVLETGQELEATAAGMAVTDTSGTAAFAGSLPTRADLYELRAQIPSGAYSAVTIRIRPDSAVGLIVIPDTATIAIKASVFLRSYRVDRFGNLIYPGGSCGLVGGTCTIFYFTGEVVDVHPMHHKDYMGAAHVIGVAPGAAVVTVHWDQWVDTAVIQVR